MRYHVIAAACFLAVLASVCADQLPQHGEVPQPVAFTDNRPPIRPPYPIRRQQTGLDRARSTMMGFMRSVMDAGARFRRMASERLSSMFNRRSFRLTQRQDRVPFRRQ